jgi:hypothetical protein
MFVNIVAVVSVLIALSYIALLLYEMWPRERDRKHRNGGDEP